MIDKMTIRYHRRQMLMVDRAMAIFLSALAVLIVVVGPPGRGELAGMAICLMAFVLWKILRWVDRLFWGPM
jgi:hypothetical protein